MKARLVCFTLFFAASAHVAAEDRFVSKLTYPTGATLVVAEGDFEPRSIGSFSVRLYEASPAPDETTFFVSGLVQARDGAVEKLLLADLDGDTRPELVVNVRSAGSGGYLSAYAFSVNDKALQFLRAVEGLAANADTVAALRSPTKK